MINQFHQECQEYTIGKKESLPLFGIGENGISTCYRMKLDLYFTPSVNNSKWVKNQSENMIVLEEHIGDIFMTLVLVMIS